MKRLGIILLLTCSMIGIWANPLSKIYLHDDPILKSIELLSIEAGIVPQHTELPTTGYALVKHLDKIEGKRLSPKSRELLEEIQELLLNHHSSFPTQLKITFNPEIYANQQQEAKSQDWEYGYNERPPILHAQVESIFADRVYGIFSYGIARTESKMDFSGIETNFPYPAGSTSETNLQNSYPHTAFLGISGDRFSIIAGRDTLSWGRGNSGNLVLGDHVPYHDFFQFSLHNEKLKYSFLTIPMNELDAQGKAIVPSKANTDTLFLGTLQRLFVAHLLSIDVTPRLRLTIGEGALFYSDKLDLRMFSPVMFIHNLQNFSEVNNTMHLEVEYALSSTWSLYAQFLMDQMQTKGEQEQTELPPNAYGGLLGADFVKILPSGRISGYIEGVYTSPFLYLRTGDDTGIYDVPELDQHNLDLVHAVSMRNAESGTAWLGYQYGPDTIVGSFNLRFDHDNNFGASGTLRFIAQGERGLEMYGKKQYVELVPAEDLNLLAPSGDNIDYFLIPSIYSYMVLPGTDINVYNTLFFVNKWNNSGYTFDLQMVIGLSYSLTF